MVFQLHCAENSFILARLCHPLLLVTVIYRLSDYIHHFSFSSWLSALLTVFSTTPVSVISVSVWVCVRVKSFLYLSSQFLELCSNNGLVHLPLNYLLISSVFCPTLDLLIVNKLHSLNCMQPIPDHHFYLFSSLLLFLFSSLLIFLSTH